MKKKLLIILLFLFATPYFINLWGTYYAAKGWETPITNATDLMSPFIAYTSLIAAIGTVGAIVFQLISFTTQQFENNFFQLLEIHLNNRNNIVFNLPKSKKERRRGINAFSSYYQLFYSIYCYIVEDGILVEDFTDNEGAIRKIYNETSWIHENDLQKTISPKKAASIAYSAFTEATNCQLSPYFSHLYTMLKYISECNEKNKRNFIRILRSQISIQEYTLLYYHAMLHKDKAFLSNKSKFQTLIERYALFHNFTEVTEALPDDHAIGKYSNNAYGSQSKLRWLKLLRQWVSDKNEFFKKSYPRYCLYFCAVPTIIVILLCFSVRAINSPSITIESLLNYKHIHWIHCSKCTIADWYRDCQCIDPPQTPPKKIPEAPPLPTHSVHIDMTIVSPPHD